MRDQHLRTVGWNGPIRRGAGHMPASRTRRCPNCGARAGEFTERCNPCRRRRQQRDSKAARAANKTIPPAKDKAAESATSTATITQDAATGGHGTGARTRVPIATPGLLEALREGDRVLDQVFGSLSVSMGPGFTPTRADYDRLSRADRELRMSYIRVLHELREVVELPDSWNDKYQHPSTALLCPNDPKNRSAVLITEPMPRTGANTP